MYLFADELTQKFINIF